MYLNSCVLLANNSLHLYVNSLRNFSWNVYLISMITFLSFSKKNLLPLIPGKELGAITSGRLLLLLNT